MFKRHQQESRANNGQPGRPAASTASIGGLTGDCAASSGSASIEAISPAKKLKAASGGHGEAKRRRPSDHKAAAGGGGPPWTAELEIAAVDSKESGKWLINYHGTYYFLLVVSIKDCYKTKIDLSIQGQGYFDLFSVVRTQQGLLFLIQQLMCDLEDYSAFKIVSFFPLFSRKLFKTLYTLYFIFDFFYNVNRIFLRWNTNQIRLISDLKLSCFMKIQILINGICFEGLFVHLYGISILHVFL